MDTKEKKLWALLSSIINHSVYGEHIRTIADEVNISIKDIENEFIRYNIGTHDAIGNEIYKSVANRFVLYIHNLIDGSWHTDRQAIITEFVKSVDAKNIVDIGFGVPTKYVRDLVLNSSTINVTFVDMYDSAFVFAKHLLDLWAKNWSDKITFKKLNLDYDDIYNDYDLYIFQDSIEHAKDPTKVLMRTVNLSAKNAKFIISLPIGPIFPRHYMEWLTDDDAKTWIKSCGLEIEKEASVYTNPKIDLFAEQIDPKYHDLYFLCSK